MRCTKQLCQISLVVQAAYCNMMTVLALLPKPEQLSMCSMSQHP